MKNASPIFSPKASFGREERSSTQNTIPTAAVAEVRQFEVIKIAIDMHSAMWVASRQLANRGKSLLLGYGLPSSWSWWKPDRWDKIKQMIQDQKPHLAATNNNQRQ